MPELPEVEVTRRGVAAAVEGKILRKAIIREHRFRWPILTNLSSLLEESRLLITKRRGKYLLLQFEQGTLIIHLGMSGSLRIATQSDALRKHDHVDLIFDEHILRLHDPRRFGAVVWHPLANGPIEQHPLLIKLGIEPFDPEFDGAWLFKQTRTRNTAIKTLILAGNIVVGAGNIYACESLFRARIHPLTPASKISRVRYQRLAAEIRATLQASIDAGGSTLRDYVGTNGDMGSFQISTFVYDRQNQPCRICQTPIQRLIQGQRSTFFCPSCQKR